MSDDARGLLANPEWLAHRYAEAADQVQFRRVTRAEHRAATFITDDHLEPAETVVPLSRADARAAAPPPAPVHFVFHSAFCCSTLVARAFDLEGLAFGLKEPVILNDIAGFHGRGGARAQVTAALDAALMLLARPFQPGEAVIVKPSNVTNALAPAMLALRPDARALLLYAPLRVYLGSIARKGLDGRLWVRDLLAKLLKAGLVDLGFTAEDYFRQTDLQVAATGWLAQQALFNRMIQQFGPVRVRSLDSETLVADPKTAIAALAAQFGIAATADQLRTMAEGPAFTTHSKSGTSFGAGERRKTAAEGEEAHRDEIEKVAVWADAVAKSAGVPLTLPAPLV